MDENDEQHVCAETYEGYLDRCQAEAVEPLPRKTWETVVRDGKFMKELFT